LVRALRPWRPSPAAASSGFFLLALFYSAVRQSCPASVCGWVVMIENIFLIFFQHSRYLGLRNARWLCGRQPVKLVRVRRQDQVVGGGRTACGRSNAPLPTGRGDFHERRKRKQQLCLEGTPPRTRFVGSRVNWTRADCAGLCAGEPSQRKPHHYECNRTSGGARGLPVPGDGELSRDVPRRGRRGLVSVEVRCRLRSSRSIDADGARCCART
jgi:hypothetical protein